MSVDATIERLTGARIVKAVRRKHAIELDTDKGRVIVGTVREVEDGTCYGCGESRPSMISIVETAGKREAFCSCCSHHWILG